MAIKKARPKKASQGRRSAKGRKGLRVSKATLEAFEAPNGGTPIGERGVVIGATSANGKSVFYYVIEQGGKYFFQAKDGTLTELPTLEPAGQAIVRELTNRGALVADIDPEDAGGLGGYCYLLSIENLAG